MFNTNTWNRIRYSLYTPFYDVVGRLFTSGRRVSIANLTLHHGQRVLLVGAGTGLDIELLPDTVDIVATDITPAMVRRIEQRVQKLGKSVTAEVQDGQALGYPDASFDVVVLHLILAVIPDPVACLKECARVLKPGGQMAVYDKFLAQAGEITGSRKLLNAVAGPVFSEINRKLEPIVATVSDLHIVEDDNDARFPAYRIVLIKKDG